MRRPTTVWAWLVQIGQDRAGFYSYTWLENLFRCDMPRVERIVSEWQQRTLGDIVWLARRDRYRGEARQKVVRIDRGRVFSMASPSDWGRLVRRETSPRDGTWTFILVPSNAGTTRLIVRSRGPEAPTLLGRLFWVSAFEPAHFIMERKMLLQIKALAEEERSTGCPARLVTFLRVSRVVIRRSGSAMGCRGIFPIAQEKSAGYRGCAIARAVSPEPASNGARAEADSARGTSVARLLCRVHHQWLGETQ